MAYEAGRGKTLLVPSGTTRNPDKKHLFVVATDASNNNQHLLVPICSIVANRYHDPACKLGAGEHPFLRRDSYTAYNLCTVKHASQITKLVDSWFYRQKEDMPAHVLDKICRGIEISQFIPRYAKNYFLNWPDD